MGKKYRNVLRMEGRGERVETVREVGSLELRAYSPHYIKASRYLEVFL